jgi:hypothetical protein
VSLGSDLPAQETARHQAGRGWKGVGGEASKRKAASWGGRGRPGLGPPPINPGNATLVPLSHSHQEDGKVPRGGQ